MRFARELSARIAHDSAILDKEVAGRDSVKGKLEDFLHTTALSSDASTTPAQV